MNIDEYTPVSPARLKRMKWRAERAYQVFSYPFSIRWNGDLTGDRVHYALGSFALPGDGAARRSASGDEPNVYSLIDMGPRELRRYRLLLADEQLIGSGSADDVLYHLLYQISTRMVEHTEEFLLIHAGSVVTPRGEGVLLPADSGSGKTTLVAGLIEAGFGFLSDELGVIDPVSGRLHPYPRALIFKEESLALFPRLPPPDDASPLALRARYLRPEEIRPGVVEAEPCEVRFVIAPRYQRGATTRITPLSPAETVKAMWAHAMNLPLHGARAVPVLADVAMRARGYRLVSQDLAEAVRTVQELTGSA